MRICGETWSSYTLNSVLILGKDIFTFEPNTKPGSEEQGCGWEFELVWICAYGWRL